MKKKLVNFILLILIILFLGSSFLIGNRIYEYSNYSSLNESLQHTITERVILSEEVSGIKENNDEQEKIFSDERYIRVQNLYELRNTNKDVFGWIQIPGLAVNYPVVQNLMEPDYYLKRDINGNKSSYGTIYMDANCIRGRAKNYILYGHHMRDGSMFAAINHYDDINFYNQYPVIEFDMLTGPNDYQIIGAFKISASKLSELEDIIMFSTEEDFNEFKTFFESNKFYNTDIDYSYEDDFLTLMTCEYTYNNGRFFVLAKRI